MREECTLITGSAQPGFGRADLRGIHVVTRAVGVESLKCSIFLRVQGGALGLVIVERFFSLHAVPPELAVEFCS